MSVRVGMISLGCCKNQVDTEHMLAKFDNEGFEIVDYIDGADVVVINTCGFIDDAKKEAIETILETTQMKEEGLIQKVIVTGCLAQRYKDELLEEIPEIDTIIGIGNQGNIIDVIKNTLSGEGFSAYAPQCDLPLEGERLLTTPEHWAYLKIADGCSNYCTYCTIPSIRGEMRSRKEEDIISEATALAAGGVKELILIAQDTTAYGADIYGELRLSSLLEKLSEIEGIKWLRLLYCYPDKVTPQLIEVIKTNEKVLHYIDLPLQHIDDKILSAMNRRSDSTQIRSLITKLREEIPDMVIRTTFITGFPGEGDEEFENLENFVNEIEFERLGCFTFSPQEGTPAFYMEEQVDEDIKMRRSEIIMGDQYEIISAKNQSRIDNVYTVLVEGYDAYTDSYFGRTYMDAPEIDGTVIFTGEAEYNDGDFVDVKIFDVNEYDLLGEVVV